MLKFSVKIYILFTFIYFSCYAQEQNPFNLDSSKVKVNFYGSLFHQHHDFFGEAFSFQGIEGGILVEKKYLAGIYASSFVSNLKVNFKNEPKYFSLAQSGILCGYYYSNFKNVYSGVLINLGYVSIIGYEKSFPLFKPKNPAINLGGIVCAPQLFAEIPTLNWLQIRIGLAYNFYFLEENSKISNSDLNNISFNFGFIFGDFD